MDKLLLTDITVLEYKDVLKALKVMRDNKCPVTNVRLGEGVRLGPGVDEYFKRLKIEVE